MSCFLQLLDNFMTSFQNIFLVWIYVNVKSSTFLIIIHDWWFNIFFTYLSFFLDIEINAAKFCMLIATPNICFLPIISEAFFVQLKISAVKWFQVYLMNDNRMIFLHWYPYFFFFVPYLIVETLPKCNCYPRLQFEMGVARSHAFLISMFSFS